MTNKLRLMLLAMATLGVVGCADKLTDDVVQSPEDIGGETGYLSFRIKSADTGGMTRAWKDDDGENKDFSFGSEAAGIFAHEDAIVNNIQANRVFFFKKDGTYHSSSFLSLAKESGSHSTADKDHPGAGSTEKTPVPSTYPEIVYSATVKRTSDRGDQDWPGQCLVILNGRPSRLNALLARAQADPEFNIGKFKSWVNEDFRNTDVAGEGLTLGLYQSSDGAINGTDDKKEMYYFTMSNSVFLDETNNLVDATQIDIKNNLKPTSEAAADAPITVYVERIMSKIEVGFTGYDGAVGNDAAYFDDNTNGFIYTFTDDHETNSKWFDGKETKKLKALITNWTINAVEYQTRLFKGIQSTWTDNNLFNGWNDERHHRSYWAIDPNYKWDPERYPTQYRKSFGGSSSTKSYEDERVEYPNHGTAWNYGDTTEEDDGNDVMNDKYPWALDYKAFDKIVNKRKFKYCLENTFEKYTPEIEDGQAAPKYVAQNMIMGSHLLVQARLLTEDEENLQLEKIQDKYYYSDRYYTEDAYITRQLAVINEVLDENVAIGDNSAYEIKNIKMWTEDTDVNEDKFNFANIAGGLWIKEGGKYKRVVASVNEDNKDNEIAATDVFTIAPAYVDKGDGKVTIALKGDDTTYGYETQDVNLYYVKQNVVKDGQPYDKVLDLENNNQETEEENICQFTRNQLVSLIYNATNVADCFKKGMMYYAVPIQHFIAGTHTDADGNRDGNYEYKYENIETGDYGVVRNHWYKFTINAIAKPGIPVHDPDQPIIPNYDMEDRYIGFEVVILPWHIVDNGNVTLGQ